MTTLPTRLIVGTYARLGGAGLVALTVTAEGLLAGEPIASLADASFGLRVAGGRMLFVVEQPVGQVAMLAPGDHWAEQARVPSGGAAPCHLALDPAGGLLAVANYQGGSVALVRVGKCLEPGVVTRLTGRGADPARQAGPHAHWVGFHGGGLYCVDLGSDRIWWLAVDRAAGTLGSPTTAYIAPLGSGPRHLVFHPTRPRAYLVSELASTLTILAVTGNGQLEALDTVSTLPPRAGADSLGGAILLDAPRDRLYVTNRGHDSIVTFALNGDSAIPIDHRSSGGASPRYLLLLSETRRLLVANEESGTVLQFRLDADGRPAPVGEPARIPGAVFLSELPA